MCMRIAGGFSPFLLVQAIAVPAFVENTLQEASLSHTLILTVAALHMKS